MVASAISPVRVDAALDPRLSRWLWAVKWLLVVPHYLVLAVLWVAFVLLSVVAFFGILFTGRYPRSIFTFNVGVLRWSWRVAYYAYGALGTDRYPPFTLAEVPTYPAHLDIAYPEHLSRGLVLVKWWLLAIPHYLIVGVFLGSGTWVAWRYDNMNLNVAPGLIGLLVAVAAVMLLFTGRYPQPVYDFVLGLNRWVLRVAAYAGLMTDQYPPFRLDTGGGEPGATLTMPRASHPAGPMSGDTTAPGAAGWTPGRVLCLVAGSLLAVTSAGMFFAGGTALWADATQRDGGYLTSPASTFNTAGYALASDGLIVHVDGLPVLASLVGDARVRVTSNNPATPIFLGIAPAAAADRYLGGVAHATVRQLRDHVGGVRAVAGGPPAHQPDSAGIWARSVTGTGTQSLIWPLQSGRWTVVAMNADGSPGVSLRADVGASAPSLGAFGGWLLTGGGLVLLGAVALIVVPIRRAAR